MRIRIKNKIFTNDFDNYEDLLKLQKLMFELGFCIYDLQDIQDMWDEISDNYCACWLIIPETKEELLQYLERIEI